MYDSTSPDKCLCRVIVLHVCLRAREKRLREAAEERRMKELRKKAQEDAEEEERQRVSVLDCRNCDNSVLGYVG